MLCVICKKLEATVHLTQIDGQKMLKVDLCEACAKTKGVNEPGGFSLTELLLGLDAAKEIVTKSGGEDEAACPACGFTKADFKKSGRLGCAECYAAFSDGMEALLKSMHKGIRHVGKAPAALRQTRDASERLRLLQKKLEKVISAEDFEQAALLRDEIKAAKAQQGQSAAK